MCICRRESKQSRQSRQEVGFEEDYAKHLQIKAQHYKLQLKSYVLFELQSHERLLKQDW